VEPEQTNEMNRRIAHNYSLYASCIRKKKNKKISLGKENFHPF
jgi:hypothetical protein